MWDGKVLGNSWERSDHSGKKEDSKQIQAIQYGRIWITLWTTNDRKRGKQCELPINPKDNNKN